MPLTSQQLADQLLAQWQLLWWAKPAERLRIIDETKKDMEFELTLHNMEKELNCEFA